jgi:hypothetical protein
MKSRQDDVRFISYGNFTIPILTFLLKSSLSRPLKGVTPKIVSNKLTPKLHISAFSLYNREFNTSGAILRGVPH